MAEGEEHFDAVLGIRETLRSFFRRGGQDLYIAANLSVFYPGEPAFSPDILAVWGVEGRQRRSYIVAREGKGLELIIEVLDQGKRTKDLRENVTRYARLGIREYFVLDLPQHRIWAYRLPAGEAGEGERRYEAVLGNLGRYPSEVLGLQLSLRGGVLRFFYGSAELLSPHEELGRLAESVATEQAQAAQALAQAELERAEKEVAMERLRAAILSLLRVRGLGPSPEAAARIAGCSDLSLLSRWLDRAADAPLEALFIDG